MTVWFTSDTHFCHEKVARIRGFGSTFEHDTCVVKFWNTVVKPDDLVWHLGDVSMSRKWDETVHWVMQLNGRKHLVAGNHDPCWPGHRRSRNVQLHWMALFESVQAFARIRLAGTTYLLSHFPYQNAGDHTPTERYTQFRLPNMGEYLLHGHTHTSEHWDGPKSLHVGLDAWGLQPVWEQEVISATRIKERDNG